ncbi:MAG: LrgB family protein [Candidatus Eremiobacteraeota bacterium]|nr:LrgB family protein [Candidatus Eremiobacteraeota bacterium]
MSGQSLALCAVCVLAYVAGRRVSRLPLPRARVPFASPVIVGTALVCAFSCALHVDRAIFAPVVQVATILLVPATMALALPVFRNRAVLGDRAVLAIASLVAGSFVAMLSGVILARALGLAPAFQGMLAIKSATSSVSLDIAHRHGLDPVATAALVIGTGVFGAAFGPALLALARVRHPIARGLAYGSTSHAIGTARALVEGELTGAVSGVALCLNAVFVSAIGPLAMWLALSK